jgi:L-amino acid N-acyltransferase YncA
MTSADEEIGLAARDDIAGILELQEENLIDRGGALSVAFPHEFLETAIAEMPVIVARKDGRVIGYLMSSPLAAMQRVPIIDAMLRAYKVSAGAYLYGPICVAQAERGRGLAGRLFAALCEELPRREGILFIRRDNASSLRAHAKMGLREVAEFTHDGVAHAVLSYIG